MVTDPNIISDIRCLVVDIHDFRSTKAVGVKGENKF